MRFLLPVLLSVVLYAGVPAGEVKAYRPATDCEDCRNGLDDDGDGLTDLRDPDCRCNPRPLPTGPELIINGGFEELADGNACSGCISLFRSDNCPVGWRQESVNLHTPCFISANPSINISYVNGASDNYQGLGGYGRASSTQRQQEEYLATRLDAALERGVTYRFAANFALPAAELDGINEAPIHRIAILGSRSGTDLIRSPDRCYSDDPAWDLLATIEIANSARPSFINYSTGFIANDRYRHLAIASDCCQETTSIVENLTYWAVDDVSLKTATPHPVEAEIIVVPRGCDQNVFELCTDVPAGNWAFQWYQDSTAIVGATQDCLALTFAEARGQNFSLWITGPDNCRIIPVTLPEEIACEPLTEICTNGRDDDGDRLIDADDPDCGCLNNELEVSAAASRSVVLRGARVQLQLTTDAPSPQISWTPVAGLSCTDCPAPFFTMEASGTYSVTVLDPESGCSGTDSVSVIVVPARAVYLPGAFSPNADGINDAWRPRPGPEVESIHDLRVFDRWGNLVYESTSAAAWDGRDQPAGYYVVQFTVRFQDGHEERRNGSILLLR